MMLEIGLGKLVCIENTKMEEYLTLNKEYLCSPDGKNYIKTTNDKGQTRRYKRVYFITRQEQRDLKLKELGISDE